MSFNILGKISGEVHIFKSVYLNNKMLSFMIYAGYEGGDIAGKMHNQR